MKFGLFLCAFVSLALIAAPKQTPKTQQAVPSQQNAALPESSVRPVEAVPTKIILGSKVYITPMDAGFDSYLAAAFGKKKVPLVLVGEKDHADYVITGSSIDKKAGWAKIVFMGNIHSDNAASITLTDVKSGAILYAYAVDKKSTLHGQQTTAEACAKHLKSHIEAKE